MSFPRRSGLLLHITSLPGRFGVGDLGPEARRFADFLSEAGQSLWQVLPLNPPSYGNSPYATLSSFAWSPLLISPELLVQDGYLDARDLAGAPAFSQSPADFDGATHWKRPLLQRAYERFRNDGSAAVRHGDRPHPIGPVVVTCDRGARNPCAQEDRGKHDSRNGHGRTS